MATASNMELLKSSMVNGSSTRKPGYEAVLNQHVEESAANPKGEHFVRFRPDGSLAVIKKEVEIPQIDEDEVHRRRLEQIEREVYQKAFAEGEKTGIEIGQEKMEQEIHRLIPQLESVLRNLDNLPQRVFAASEHFMVESMLSICRELLAHELTINPEGIAERVNRIMERSMGRKDITIKVSPGIADILQHLQGFEQITIVGDPGVNPGSVVMESDFGGIEDNIEEQLREVELALRLQLQERLDQSGVTDVAEAAREKTMREEEAPIAPLAADPIIEKPVIEPEPQLLEEDEDDDDEFPLESVGDDILGVEAPEEPAANGEFAVDPVSDDDLESFLDEADSGDSLLDAPQSEQPVSEPEPTAAETGGWSALSDDEPGTDDLMQPGDDERE